MSDAGKIIQFIQKNVPSKDDINDLKEELDQTKKILYSIIENNNLIVKIDSPLGIHLSEDNNTISVSINSLFIYPIFNLTKILGLQSYKHTEDLLKYLNMMDNPDYSRRIYRTDEDSRKAAKSTSTIFFNKSALLKLNDFLEHADLLDIQEEKIKTIVENYRLKITKNDELISHWEELLNSVSDETKKILNDEISRLEDEEEHVEYEIV